jgi:hypothetical protein
MCGRAVEFFGVAGHPGKPYQMSLIVGLKGEGQGPMKRISDL